MDRSPGFRDKRRAFPGRLWPSQWHRATPYSPGHSGGTAPVSHRTSLDHRPYVERQSIAARGLRLALTLLDLALELLDDLGHRLSHPRELPVLDLDHPEPGGGDDGCRAL